MECALCAVLIEFSDHETLDGATLEGALLLDTWTRTGVIPYLADSPK